MINITVKNLNLPSLQAIKNLNENFYNLFNKQDIQKSSNIDKDKTIA